MTLVTRIKKPVLFGLLGTTLVLASACSGVSQADLDAAKQQAATAEQKATSLQQQLSAKTKEASDLQAKAADLEKKAAAKASDVITLLGVKSVPKPAPPAPPAPGTTPAPKPTPPPSLYEPVQFAFYVETLATESVGPALLASTVACTPDAVFKRGMKLVWRFEIFDISTGKRITDKDGATVTINIPKADTITSRFSQRGGGRVPGAPFMWSGGWDIPLDYPVGSLDYTITIKTKDGRTATWQTPAITSPTSDSRVKIIS